MCIFIVYSRIIGGCVCSNRMDDSFSYVYSCALVFTRTVPFATRSIGGRKYFTIMEVAKVPVLHVTRRQVTCGE